MSMVSRNEQEQIRAAQAKWLEEHSVTKCPPHAQTTGQSRFVYASRAARAREEAIAAEGMQEVRNG